MSNRPAHGTSETEIAADPEGSVFPALALWGDKEHRLARILYTKFEEIDPTSDAPSWDGLDYREKIIYLRLIVAVLNENDACKLSPTTTS